MTSKPHSCNPREIFSVEVLTVRCPVTALTDLRDLGYRVKWYKVSLRRIGYNGLVIMCNYANPDYRGSQ
jgi:hypothetical protein